MTSKNAMVMFFSFGLFATATVMGDVVNTSLNNSAQPDFLLSDSNTVEIAERGSGRIDPDATSQALERHLFS